MKWIKNKKSYLSPLSFFKEKSNQIYSFLIVVLVLQIAVLAILVPLVRGVNSTTHTSQEDFAAGAISQTAVTNSSGGEISLATVSSSFAQQSFGTNSLGEVGVKVNDLYAAYSPSLVHDSLGNTYVAYFFAGSTWDIVVKKYDSAGAQDLTFGTAGTLTISSSAVAGGIMPNTPSLVVDNTNSNLYVAWDAGAPLASAKTIYAKKFSFAGVIDTSFGTSGLLTAGSNNKSISTDHSFSISIDTNSKLYIATNGTSGTSLTVKRYTTAGALDASYATSGTLTAVSTGNAVGDPYMVVNGGDNLYLLYYENISGPHKIYARKFNSSGVTVTSFGASGILEIASSTQALRDPVVVFGGSENGYVVWTEAANNDIYAKKFSTAGVLDTSFGTSGMATITTASNIQRKPALALDSSENMYIAWEDNRGADYSIYTKKFNSSGTLVSGFGTAGELATFDNSNNQFYPAIMTDATGDIYLAASDDRSTGNTKYDLYIRKFNSSGTRYNDYSPATADDVAISGESSSQEHPASATDSDNNVYFVWRNMATDANGDIYMKKYSAMGFLYDGTSASPEFGTDGQVLISSAGTNAAQRAPRITLDSTDNIYVSWYDNRDGANYDAYVKKFSSSGALDATFGSSGELTVEAGILIGAGESDELPTEMGLGVDSSDNIYVAYYKDLALDGADYAVYIRKYSSAGVIVSAFGSSGTLTVASSSLADTFPTLTISSANNLYVGYVEWELDFSDSKVKIKKYNSSGTIDSAFGTSGTITYDNVGDIDREARLALDSTGAVYLASGNVDDLIAPTAYQIFLTKYDSAGVIVTSFGTGGTITLATSANATIYPSIATDSADNIYATWTQTVADNDIKLRVYNTAGTLNTNVGTNGVLVLDSTTANANQVAITVGAGDAIYFAWSDGAISGAKYDFTGGSTVYYTSGTFESATIDTGSSTQVYGNLSWSVTTPVGTSVLFQVATATTDSGYVYRGPGGFLDTYYTTSSGHNIWSGADSQRYFRYKMILATTDATASPSVASVTIAYNLPPNAPSSLGPMASIDGTASSNTRPNFSFTLTDNDTSDTVGYRIQISQVSDFSSSIVDYTSAMATQGTASFSVGQATGSGSYTTGWLNQTLSEGNYYWRVAAIDENNLIGNWTTANSGNVALTISLPPSYTAPIESTGGGGGVEPKAATPEKKATETFTDNFSININDDQINTTNLEVTLRFSAPSSATEVEISNYPDFKESTRDQFAREKKWSICADKDTGAVGKANIKTHNCSEGEYSVYARFYNAKGEMSAVFRDTISYRLNTKDITEGANQAIPEKGGTPQNISETISPNDNTGSQTEILPALVFVPDIIFFNNMRVGSNGVEVKALQEFLNKNGFTVADNGPGSSGGETQYYGALTARAVARFQEANADQILTPLGYTKGTGIFGPATRNYINSLK
ncbi:peptidoglycan-binding protein [Candidatus Microgenomates bacterium]|nr:peptidoglycan-binding protein [Candidatus Microgenomates bacterium]